LAGLFAWGFYFGLFGTEISWSQHPLATSGFFGWLVLGAFGVGYGSGRKYGFRYAAYAFALITLVITIREAPRLIG
jgi:hypothetical protein